MLTIVEDGVCGTWFETSKQGVSDQLWQVIKAKARITTEMSQLAVDNPMNLLYRISAV